MKMFNLIIIGMCMMLFVQVVKAEAEWVRPSPTLSVTTFINESFWNLSGNDIYYLDGNVGIGTSEPTNTLNVIGDINSTGIFYGNGSGLTNLPASAISDIWVNESGDTMTGDLDLNANKLTQVGELIMEGVITSENIFPATNGLYSLGNATRWYEVAYIKNIFANNLNSTNITSNYLNSDTIDSNSIDVENNITIGTFNIKEDGTDLVLVLS